MENKPPTDYETELAELKQQLHETEELVCKQLINQEWELYYKISEDRLKVAESLLSKVNARVFTGQFPLELVNEVGEFLKNEISG